MNTRMNQQQQHSPQSSPQSSAPKAKAGDYIDFEEVK
jgi:hypothetical protein